MRSNTLDGKSLNDLYQDTKELVQNGRGDISILLSALNEVKIKPQNITKYDSFRYTAIKEVSYDCCKTDFPRLIPENLKLGQFNVKYELLLSKVNNYIIDITQFEEEKE